MQLIEKGESLLKNKQYLMAIPIFEDILISQSNNGVVWHNLGNCFCKVGQSKNDDSLFRKSLNAYSKALELNPKHIVLWRDRGWVKYKLGDHEGAVADYKKAIDLEPSNSKSWYDLGILYKNTKQYSEAAPCFEQVTILKPSHQLAWQKLGEVKEKTQDYSRALEAFEKSYSLKKDTIIAEKINNLGNMLGLKGNAFMSVELHNSAILGQKQQLERLKKLIQVSKSLKIEQMAKMLMMSNDELYNKIIDWAVAFNFTIDQDVVEFNNANKIDFLSMLDSQFQEWEKSEQSKIGKIK
jgi:tetratricopeptide (TPR) repeat protein